MRRHDDIEQTISEIEHFQLNMNDHTLGPHFWEEAMKDFLSRHSIEIIRMLKELERLRDKADAQKKAEEH